MNITFEQFKEYLTEFVKLKNEKDSWLDKLPEDFISIYDNNYTNGLGLQLDLTMQLLLGDAYEDVCWFIYDCLDIKNVKSYPDTEDKPNVIVNNVEYYIHDLESYLNYAEKELTFKQVPLA